MDRPTCKTCPCWDELQPVRSWPGRQEVINYGACKLYPHTTPHKKADDWCGQHPDHRRWAARVAANKPSVEAQT